MMFTVMVMLSPGSRSPFQLSVRATGLYTTVAGLTTGVPKMLSGN